MDGLGGGWGGAQAPLQGELPAKMMETVHLQSHRNENEWIRGPSKRWGCLHNFDLHFRRL